MAFISKEQVQEKNKKLKELNKKYGVKGIFSGSNSSTLTLTIHEGSLDFVKWYIDFLTKYKSDSFGYYTQQIKYIENSKNFSINHYSMNDLITSKCLDYLQDACEIMLEGHYDKSDPMTDYFDCAWYMSIQVGKWTKPYKFKA